MQAREINRRSRALVKAGQQNDIVTYCVEGRAHIRHTIFKTGNPRDDHQDWHDIGHCDCAPKTAAPVSGEVVTLPPEVEQKVMAFLGE